MNVTRLIVSVCGASGGLEWRDAAAAAAAVGRRECTSVCLYVCARWAHESLCIVASKNRLPGGAQFEFTRSRNQTRALEIRGGDPHKTDTNPTHTQWRARACFLPIYPSFLPVVALLVRYVAVVFRKAFIF